MVAKSARFASLNKKLNVEHYIALAQLLVEENFPAIAIHYELPEEERHSWYQQFKDFQWWNLVAFHLFSWGIDIKLLNIAFNYNMCKYSNTCLHHVAKAGHCGTKGLAAMFVSGENDAKVHPQH